MTLRFGDCRLSLRSRRLLRGSLEVHLSPKAFDVLRLLVESRPQALSKSELLSQAWPGVFVSEASLSVVIAELRSGLGESARRPRFLQTVHRFGYRFDAPVVEERTEPDSAPACTFWLTWAGRDFPLVEGENFVGRDEAAHVRLHSSRVSRRHARIVVADGCATIEDLGSKNGTDVGGLRLQLPKRLDDGDEIRIDAFQLVFRTAQPGAVTKTAPGGVRGSVAS